MLPCNNWQPMSSWWPMTGLVTPLLSPVDGVFYARETRRFVPAGAGVLRVAGREALRQGKLLTS